jgi:hypothetical protein
MALPDDLRVIVLATYPDAILRPLTNPQVGGNPSTDSDYIDRACEAVEGDFLNKGIELDVTDKRHLRTALDGVIATMQKWTTQSSEAKNEFQAYMDSLSTVAKATSRDRILPVTDSVLVPTPEESLTGSPVRPDFDRSRFDHFKPDAPGSGPTDQRSLP